MSVFCRNIFLFRCGMEAAVMQEQFKTLSESKVSSYCIVHINASVRTYSLRSSPPVCTSWAASPCNHRNWTAALRREDEVFFKRLNTLTILFINTTPGPHTLGRRLWPRLMNPLLLLAGGWVTARIREKTLDCRRHWVSDSSDSALRALKCCIILFSGNRNDARLSSSLEPPHVTRTFVFSISYLFDIWLCCCIHVGNSRRLFCCFFPQNVIVLTTAPIISL